MACMTHAMKARRRLSAGEARYEPKKQVASSVRLLRHQQKGLEGGSAQARRGMTLESAGGMQLMLAWHTR